MALRASEELWRKVFESSPAGIALTGVHYHFIQGPREEYQIEKRLRRKDDNLLRANINVGFAPSAPSRAGFFVAITEDVTERKRAEEALQKAQPELVHVTRVTALFLNDLRTIHGPSAFMPESAARSVSGRTDQKRKWV